MLLGGGWGCRLSTGWRVAGAALALALGSPVLLAPMPSYAAVDRDVACVEIEDSGTEETYRTDDASLPLAALGVERTHRAMTGDGLPGAGVRVAVIDSGVDDGSGLLDVVHAPSWAGPGEAVDYHGTAVAGLIAGKPRGDQLTGVAPGATIVDVRVYDDDAPTEEGAVGVEIDRVVRGLTWVARNAEDLRIGVVTIALRVDPSPELAAVVRELHREADVVVVTASGNRPTDDADPLLASYGALRPGEDAAKVIYPAGYGRDVVAVSATLGGHPDEAAGGDARTFVLQNSATDLAAPTYGAVTLGLNGSTCLLEDVATSWAAAEVSGVVALLRAQYPRESADRIIARLIESAGGAAEDRNVVVGAGVVQPLEAITRPLTPTRGGDLHRSPPAPSAIPPALAPGPTPDPAARARQDAVWFGLVGGGAVVVALLLRPVLARRRT